MHLCSALEQSLFGVGGISGLNEMMAGVGDQMCCQGLPLIPFLKAVASEESVRRPPTLSTLRLERFKS